MDRGAYMATQTTRKNKRDKIREVAGELFLTQGYAQTSMRQIAQESGVSLGLVTYHFAEKNLIAYELLAEKLQQLSIAVSQVISVEEDAVLYSGCVTKLSVAVSTSSRFQQFYLDALREDVYLKVILDSGISSYQHIRDQHQLSLSDEYLQLYGNYIAVSMERTLLLYGTELDSMDRSIPDLIFHAYMGRIWGTEEELDAYCEKSTAMVTRIASLHPELFSGWNFKIHKNDAVQ